MCNEKHKIISLGFATQVTTIQESDTEEASIKKPVLMQTLAGYQQSLYVVIIAQSSIVVAAMRFDDCFASGSSSWGQPAHMRHKECDHHFASNLRARCGSKVRDIELEKEVGG